MKKNGDIKDAELVPTETGAIQQAIATRPSMDIEALMGKALEQNASIETVERLVMLSEKMRAQWAKQQFTQALGKFQAECGAIVKTKPVFRKGATPQERKAFWDKGDLSGVQYCYAPLEDILAEATPHLSRNGFSYSFRAEVNTEKKELKAICLLRHVDGHTEPEDPSAPDSGFPVPIGSDYMSKQQESGSAMSFAKRYAFLNITGLQPKGEDNDGRDRGEDREKGGGGKDQRYTQPQSKSERAERKQEPAKDAGKPAASGETCLKFPEIKRANNASSQIMKSTMSTVSATMKRHKISEEAFANAFGFPLEQLDKGGLNQTLDWIKEQE